MSPLPWSLPLRVGFRFAAAYWFLYISALFQAIPGAVAWVGKHLFGVNAKFQNNGSGDTTYHYVAAFCVLAVSLVVTGVWSVLDRKQPDYHRLHLFLRALVRFSLGTAMISYGCFKVIQSQFPAASAERLLQPFGDASPMGLLWTFMGHSAGYNVFTGAAEIAAGVPLFFRRTTTLGALIAIGAMSNVVALNFFYDVPVKLYSLHLLAMAVFLVIPEARRLANLLVLNKPVEAVKLEPLFVKPWMHRAGLALRTILLVAMLAGGLHRSAGQAETIAKMGASAEWRGVWNVEEIEMNGMDGKPIPASQRWRRFFFSRSILIQRFDDARLVHEFVVNEKDKTILLQRPFRYTRTEPDVLLLEGEYDAQPVRAKLRRDSSSVFLLTGRGFHWINEFPFNR